MIPKFRSNFTPLLMAVIFGHFYLCNPISLGCFDWPFMIIRKPFFVMINEINLLPMVVLIWCCIFTRSDLYKIISMKKYWYWYCFSIFQIVYWYFSLLIAYWILNTSTFILYCSMLWFLPWKVSRLDFVVYDKIDFRFALTSWNVNTPIRK